MSHGIRNHHSTSRVSISFTTCCGGSSIAVILTQSNTLTLMTDRDKCSRSRYARMITRLLTKATSRIKYRFWLISLISTRSFIHCKETLLLSALACLSWKDRITCQVPTIWPISYCFHPVASGYHVSQTASACGWHNLKRQNGAQDVTWLQPHALRSSCREPSMKYGAAVCHDRRLWRVCFTEISDVSPSVRYHVFFDQKRNREIVQVDVKSSSSTEVRKSRKTRYRHKNLKFLMKERRCELAAVEIKVLW